MPELVLPDLLAPVVMVLCALAAASVLLFGIWRTGLVGFKGLVLLLRQLWQSRRPVRAVDLPMSPMRPDLSLEIRCLAHETRGLVASLEHASQRSAGWRDDAPRFWLLRWATLGRDEDFRPTIGVTGEIWAWLQAAEALAESDEPQAERLASAAAAVREALLRNGPLAPRLAEMLAHLVRVDGDLHATSESPYRGPAPVLRGPVAGSEAEAEQTDDRRRREYEQVLRDHEPILSGVARKYSDDRSSYEDLLQEIKLAVWKSLDRFRGDASLKTYIARVASYRGASFLRRRKQTVPVPDDAEPGPAPSELLDDARQRVAMAEAVEALPNGQREAIMLLLEGLSYREIGDRLAITERATSVRISRARRALRRRLAGA